MSMSSGAQDADLTFHSLYVFSPHFWLVDYLYGDLLACGDVHGQMDFPEGTLAEILALVFEEIPKR